MQLSNSHRSLAFVVDLIETFSVVVVVVADSIFAVVVFETGVSVVTVPFLVSGAGVSSGVSF